MTPRRPGGSPRRPRGSLVDPVQAGWVLERAARELASAKAKRCGVAASELMQLVVEHLIVADDGTVSLEPFSPRAHHQELPIGGG